MYSAQGPIILLQGPVSGFFGLLARRLGEHGLKTIKVDFNLGDRLTDACPERLNYRGTAEDLEGWYLRLFERTRPRAVIVFGDQRPIHVVARKACDAANIPFYSFEEGYIRPDYVTFELGGNNGLSDLLTADLDGVDLPEPPKPQSFGRNFIPMSLQAWRYYVIMWLGRLYYNNALHHRSDNIWYEIVVWNRAFGQKIIRRKFENYYAQKFAQANDGRYFLLALQKFDDSQIHTHGRSWTVDRLIEDGMRTFAECAAPDALLVVKQHPLDVGYRSYTRKVRDLARRFGIESRVTFLRNGKPPALLRHCIGVVTINSTMGMSALDVGRPVLTLGDAFYARKGLAIDGGSDGMEALRLFWREREPVDRNLERQFRRFVISLTQVNGDFYIRRSWPWIVDGVLRRFGVTPKTPPDASPAP